MSFIEVLEILKEYDLMTIIVVALGYYLMSKKIMIVDKAVNNRPSGTSTLSEEVTTIHRKVDVMNTEISYIKDDLNHLKRL